VVRKFDETNSNIGTTVGLDVNF